MPSNGYVSPEKRVSKMRRRNVLFATVGGEIADIPTSVKRDINEQTSTPRRIKKPKKGGGGSPVYGKSRYARPRTKR